MDKKNIIDNPIIKKIINELNLNNNQINSGLDIFKEIIEQNKNLDKYKYLLKVEIYDENSIIGIYIPNDKMLNIIKRNKFLKLSNISQIDERIKFSNPRIKYKISLSDNLFYWKIKNNDRIPLAKWIKELYINSQNKITTKGLYIYGNYGVGKTFFLQALLNYLIDKEMSVIYFKTCDLYELMKKNIDSKSDDNDEIINTIKTCDFLLIDDLGNEKQSFWFLYTVLLQIIEYRLKQKMTTLITSYFSLNNLLKYWKKFKDLDDIKSQRLIEKIRSLCVEIELKGDNLSK